MIYGSFILIIADLVSLESPIFRKNKIKKITN